MAYSLEAALHIPLSLLLISAAVLQFPLEYQRSRQLTEAALLAHEKSPVIYEQCVKNVYVFAQSRAEPLIELILWGADTKTALEDWLKKEGLE